MEAGRTVRETVIKSGRAREFTGSVLGGSRLLLTRLLWHPAEWETSQQLTCVIFLFGSQRDLWVDRSRLCRELKVESRIQQRTFSITVHEEQCIPPFFRINKGNC